MQENTAWWIELANGWRAELIHAYKGEVELAARTQLLSLGPAALWILSRGEALIEWPDGSHASLKVSAGESVLLPERTRRITLSHDVRLISVRFRVRSPEEVSAGVPCRPWVQKCDTRLLRLSSHLVTTIARGFDVDADRVILRQRRSLQAAPVVRQLEYDLEWRASFARWMRAVLNFCDTHDLLAPLEPQRSERANAIIRALSKASLSADTSLEDAAKSVGISMSTLKRTCRAEFALSPSEWVHRHRLEHVIARLRDPRRQIKEVALESGFSSAAHFSLWFRQQMRMTPTAFRKQVSSAL